MQLHVALLWCLLPPLYCATTDSTRNDTTVAIISSSTTPTTTASETTVQTSSTQKTTLSDTGSQTSALVDEVSVVLYNTTVPALPTRPAKCPALSPHYLEGVSRAELVTMMTDACRYDRLVRPGNRSSPLPVTIRAYIYLFQSNDGQSVQFQVQMLLQMRYTDRRLAYQTLAPSVDEVTGEADLQDRVWTPHLFLSNEHSSNVMGTGQGKDVRLTVYPDGTVVYAFRARSPLPQGSGMVKSAGMMFSPTILPEKGGLGILKIRHVTTLPSLAMPTFDLRLKAIVFCWMKLAKFPFDQQQCNIELQSWTYNTSDLILQWEKDSPVRMNPSLHLTEYTLVDMWTNETINSYSYPAFPNTPFPDGNYSSIKISFELSREIGFYMMDYYVPSILLVVISWVSFWLDPNAQPARVTLGTSTMLTFITLSSKTSSQLPKVSYIKASEIWFIGCTAFIFGSLIEFAFANTIWRRRKNVELKKVNSKYIFKSTLTPRAARKQYNQSPKSGLERSSSCPGMENRLSSSSTLSIQSSSSLLNIPCAINSSPKDEITIQEPGDNCVISLPVPTNNNTTNNSFTTMTPQEIAQWIDRRSRIVFPAAFVVFNAFYWTFVWL